MKSESMTDHAPHIKKHEHSRKVFDVMRPGRAPAGATSRPVIVGHGPKVQDPMMSHDSDHHKGHSKTQGISHLHIVEDAEKALHPPDEPLLLAHNPEETKAPEPRHVALSDHAVAVPVERPTKRDSVLDKEAHDELAALAVEGMTEFADALTIDGHLPFSGDIAQDIEGIDSSLPTTDKAPEKDPPVSTDQLAESLPPSNQIPKAPVGEDDMPDLAEIGQDVEANVNSQAMTAAATVFVNNSHSRWRTWLALCIVFVILTAVILDLLLDGGFVTLKNVPHTHFF